MSPLKVTISSAAQEYLDSLLLEELAYNVQAFGVQKQLHQLVPLTLYHGINFADAVNEPKFGDFVEMPEIFKRAAVGYHKDPRGFLRRVRAAEIE